MSVEPPSVIHRPAELMCSLVSHHVVLVHSAGQYGVSACFVNLPGHCFHRPVGSSVLSSCLSPSLSGWRRLDRWIKHECHIHQLQHIQQPGDWRECTCHLWKLHRPTGRPFSDISLSVLACAECKRRTCLLNRRLLSIAPLNSRLRSYHSAWLSLRLTGSMYVPPRLEQPPVTFHRPIGRPFSDISLSVLACAVGKCCTCLLNRCLLSIAPLEDLSLTLPGRLLRAQGVSRARLLNRRL